MGVSAWRRSGEDWLSWESRLRLDRAWSRLRAPLYRGHRLECPCCGGLFRRFLRAGRKRRRDARCPACGSLERHRLLWLYLRDRTPLLRAPLRVLHVAPEPVLHARLRGRPGLAYVPADLASPLAAERFDLTHVPHPDATFDAVLCNHVLEHVPDDRRAMRELFRVLRPGGWAVLQHPVRRRGETYEDPAITDPAERARAFGQADHVRVYGRDFEARLAEAGFRVEWIDYAHELGPEAAARHALRSADRICVARRDP